MRGLPRRSVPQLMPSTQDSAACAACGADTVERVFAKTMSVETPQGTRRFAPLIPLCPSCRGRIARHEVFAPTWCPRCDTWTPFGHRHTVDDRAETASDELRRDVRRLGDPTWVSCQEHLEATAAMSRRLALIRENMHEMQGHLALIRDEMDEMRARIASGSEKTDNLPPHSDQAPRHDVDRRDVLGGLNVSRR